VTSYKFLAGDGTGIFSRFAWPLPNGRVGAWVEAPLDPCRSGVHACGVSELPYWLGPMLYEIELDGDVVRHGMKLVAPRGRLVRRIDAWNEETREEYSQMCIARAGELAATAPAALTRWAPPREASAAGPALMGFIAARIAEEIAGLDAYLDERGRQADWLIERLGLER
jgi:hypothetical protein